VGEISLRTLGEKRNAALFPSVLCRVVRRRAHDVFEMKPVIAKKSVTFAKIHGRQKLNNLAVKHNYSSSNILACCTE
jgi:hypothetical protein